MRILLVEDHLDTLTAICKLLELRGHLVSTAMTFVEARHQCELGGFDLLLCDITLPDGDGWELGEVARLCRIPAIAMTGHESDDDEVRRLGKEFAMHLLKPIKFDDLERAIDACT